MNRKAYLGAGLVFLVITIVGVYVFLVKPTTSSRVKVFNSNNSKLSQTEAQALARDSVTMSYLSNIRLALLYYYKEHKDFPPDINSLIPKYLPSRPEPAGAYPLDQFHYFRCSAEEFHIGVSLAFNHDPKSFRSDNKAHWLANDLDKQVCINDPIQFIDSGKCSPADAGNYCLDLGKDDFSLKY